MRVPHRKQLTLDCTPVAKVELNPECRALRAIKIIEGAWVKIIEGVVLACRSSRTVASSLSVVSRSCRLVVPDPGDRVAGHLAEVDGAIVHR